MKEGSDKSYRENKKAHVYIQYLFFLRKSSRFWEGFGKYCIAGQATDDIMAHAHCMLDT